MFSCRYNVMSCHVTSCHVMSCHVMSCLHVMSCHVSCHVMMSSCHVMSCHVMSVMSCHVICHVMSCHVMSCHVCQSLACTSFFWRTQQFFLTVLPANGYPNLHTQFTLTHNMPRFFETPVPGAQSEIKVMCSLLTGPCHPFWSRRTTHR